jgi:thiosulfate/3-mercaptopyruvate sulfurtransferase
MTYSTLISNHDLFAHLHDPGWVIVDCRFDSDNPAWGHDQYLAGHIPGAVYAHQNDDLAGKVTPQSGRHPLPVPNELHQRFADWGIGAENQVVAYDDSDGSKASRLWWLLRYYGHTQAAVLDGGLLNWNKGGYSLRKGEEQNIPAVFNGLAHPEMVADLAAVDCARQDPAWLVVDARAPERYEGMVELIDLTLLSGRSPDHMIVYCGSGITACVNLLALEFAGLSGARLYPGSWSEWIRNPANPVATG